MPPRPFSRDAFSRTVLVVSGPGAGPRGGRALSRRGAPWSAAGAGGYLTGMSTGRGAEPIQVSTVNGVGAVLTKGLAALMSLCGPAVLVGAALRPEDRWIALLAGALATAVGVPAGIAVWRLAHRNRAATRRLEAVGVPAAAEVLALTLVASDEGHTYEVVMRVSGPGLDSFEVTQRRTGDGDLHVGARLRALVDPADRSYAILG